MTGTVPTVALCVVSGALLRVFECVVGNVDFLLFAFGECLSLWIGKLVGMVKACEVAEGISDFFRGRRGFNLQDFVVVFECHAGCCHLTLFCIHTPGIHSPIPGTSRSSSDTYCLCFHNASRTARRTSCINRTVVLTAPSLHIPHTSSQAFLLPPPVPEKSSHHSTTLLPRNQESFHGTRMERLRSMPLEHIRSQCYNAVAKSRVYRVQQSPVPHRSRR